LAEQPAVNRQVHGSSPCAGAIGALSCGNKLRAVAVSLKSHRLRRPIPDLIIAATAELHGAEVVHVDSDYDLIAQVTDQPIRRL
jgi:hypothetical protein